MAARQHSSVSSRWILGLFLLSAALLLTACGPASLTEEQHYQRAEALEHSGDLRGALIEWKNVVQRNPSRADARLRLGLVSLELGDHAAARAEFERAMQLGMDPSEVLLPQARTWHASGAHQRVLDELPETVSSVGDPATRAEIHRLRGEALLALGRTGEALASFTAALEQIPDSAPAHMGIAAVHAARGQPDEALAWLRLALEVDPKHHQAWALKGDVALSQNRYAAAEAAYSEAIAHSPSPYTNHVKRALTRLILGARARAEEDLRTLRRLGADAPNTAYVEGLLLYEQGDYAAAQSAFERVLARVPNFQPAVFYLGASHLAQGHWQRAERNLERYLRTHADSQEAMRLLALVRLREGDAERAESLLRRVLAQSPEDVFALDLIGQTYIARGEHEQGLDHLRRVVAIQQEDSGSRAGLAAGLMLAGERDAAMRELSAVLEQAPDAHGLELAYVFNLIRGGEFDAALASLPDLIERLPDNPIPYNLKAIALFGKGDVAGARTALQDALRLAPGDPAATINLAQMAIRQGAMQEARQLFTESLRRHPGNVSVTLHLARLEASQGDFATMQALLEDLIQKQPDVLAPRLVLARHHLSRNEPRRALVVLEPMRQAAADNEQMLDLLARVQIAAGQPAQAVTTLRALAERVSASPDVLYRLGRAFEQAGSPREARAQYQRSLELDPMHAASLQGLASLELREGRRGEALLLAQRMQQKAELAGSGYAVEGQAHLQAGENASAIRAFARANEIEPSAQHTLGLSIAQLRSGRADDATQLLARRLAEYPDEHALRFVLAEALMIQGSDAEAIREYEELLGIEPHNPVILNNLASLYHSKADPRALGLAERAHERDPQNPAVAHTLGWILVNQGEVARGLRLLETASAGLPDLPEVRFHHAFALAEAGRRAEARQELARLLDETAEFPERDQAEALLRRLR